MHYWSRYYMSADELGRGYDMRALRQDGVRLRRLPRDALARNMFLRLGARGTRQLATGNRWQPPTS